VRVKQRVAAGALAGGVRTGALRLTRPGDERERTARRIADGDGPIAAPRGERASGGAAGAVLRALGPGREHAAYPGVRIHTGEAATAAAARIGARAFTVGARDVVLAGPGDPTTDVRLMRHELAHLAQADRDATPVIARDDDEGRRYYTPDAAQNADEVIAAMTADNPIAGRGDWNQVWALLDALPTPMLLDTLREIDARGRLQEMWGNIAGRPGRVRGAIAASLLLSETAVWGELEAPMVFAELAQDLAFLPAEDLAEVKARLGGDEGFADVESSTDFGMHAPLSLIMGAAAVGPGPVNRPGQQPWPYYIGNAAHDAIAAHYVNKHPEDERWIFTNYVASSTIASSLGIDPTRTGLPTWALAMRPDIVNLGPIPGHLYEIKPWSAFPSALASAQTYLSILQWSGVNVQLGPSTDRGVQGVVPGPGGFFVFWSPWPGVILYQWGPGTFDPARFRVRGIGWQWIAIPLLAVALAAALAIAPEAAPVILPAAARFAPVLAL
jgi:hypothetical protein